MFEFDNAIPYEKFIVIFTLYVKPLLFYANEQCIGNGLLMMEQLIGNRINIFSLVVIAFLRR